MLYQPIIFPTLTDKIWKEVDLGNLAQEAFPATEKNHLLDPEFCNQWVSDIAKKHGADYTWGGHFEDRKYLWRGYYQGAEAVTHLGVDYNVPSGTPVAAPRDCKVIHSWADSSIDNGWGGRLILRLDEPWEGAEYLILGHLAHSGLPYAGNSFKKGYILGKTGVPMENGGWFPHLHVQCCHSDFLEQHMDNLTLLDGYFLVPGKPYNIAPNPSLLVGNLI